MRPKNAYQRHIVELSEKLPAITDKQKQWAIEHCFEPDGYYTKGSVWCLHCGEVFPKTTSELIISIAGDEAVCPKCGSRLKLENNRKAKYNERWYYTIITAIQGFQVCRHFIAEKTVYKASKHLHGCGEPYYTIHEAVQNWIDENGKETIIARPCKSIPRVYDAWDFAKPKSYLEVINDKNERLITFYKQVQNHFEELQEMVANSLHSEADYFRAKDIYFGHIEATELEIAWSVWIVTNFSFSGSPIGGWKWCNGSAGSHSGVFMRRKRDEFTEALKTRLQDVQISCRDAITVIKQRDTEHTFFYLDPPYPNCDQKHYRGYTTDNLEELLITLQDIKGKFILSNYNSAMLDAYIDANGWNKQEIDMPLSVANLTRSKRKTEVLVTNYINKSNLLFQ